MVIIKPIMEFIDDHAGVKPFLWQDPWGDVKQYTCSGYSTPQRKGDHWQITLNFEQFNQEIAMALQLPDPGEGDRKSGDDEQLLWLETRDNFILIDSELKRLSDSVSPMPNDIGIMGEVGAGVGVTDELPVGMKPFVGTNIRGHEQYGNYYYEDGSVMCCITAFYYRLGHPDSPNYAKYGVVNPYLYQSHY